MMMITIMICWLIMILIIVWTDTDLVCLQTHRVWALDLLGMGLSWPQSNRDATGALAYSIDTWTEQLVSFMEQVVAEPAYVAGNSLGGLLAASLGATRPDLCRCTTSAPLPSPPPCGFFHRCS